ncbi:alpha/beta fold hydrolase [Paenibacillus profundus]|uniref:Alpha/beta fold hydrolase n=1 Tax=Paenibacillus profundus TaxID=1173085 RepID=A0ABS8YFU0_9BACL|nr:MULTISPECIES: alpha/beta fold hydrolase [Paenibacillus]MCE5168384.1 alpha/beta fold hydrolase [Paenibacillus profundus]
MDMKVSSIFRSDSMRAHFTAAYDQALSEWPVSYESCFVTTDFGTTHMIKCGNKSNPPLLLIHGMTATSLMWSANIAEWSKDYYVHCIEIPGDFGKSTLVKPLSSRAAAAQWLLELVGELQLGAFHLLGHSMGGFLSLNYTVAHPLRVRSLGLLAPAGSFAPLPRMFYVKMFPAVMFPTQWFIDRAFKWCMSKHNSLELLPESYRALLAACYQSCAPRLGLLPTEFTEGELSQLPVPTLFVVGEDEVIYRHSIKTVQAKASLIPDVTIATIPRAGHFLSIEQKQRINELVIDFLRQHPISTHNV